MGLHALAVYPVLGVYVLCTSTSIFFVALARTAHLFSANTFEVFDFGVDKLGPPREILLERINTYLEHGLKIFLFPLPAMMACFLISCYIDIDWAISQ